MKFSTAFVVASLPYLLPLASAEEEPVVASEVSDAPKPSFTPTKLTAPFLEQFTSDWESRWKPSNAKKSTKADEDEWAYVGTWAVEEPSVYPVIEGDKGLIVKDAAAHHAISAKFPKKIDPKGKDLVVQYEVKLTENLQCGGAYMKLLRENKALHAEEFSNATPYVIMFGPDKCGHTNKVHFIINHKNPKTGEYEEKHFDDSVTAITESGLSTLYTLHVKPDQTFQILVNNEVEHNGTLHGDFKPAINPSKEIDDPNDKKPADWVEEQMIPDAAATKPEDWDEDAPFQIPDEEAEKPADWLDNEPKMIPDPEAEKPNDWDDEEDGDWAPPMVPNPRCVEASGCGEWERPSKSNPAYKGKWSAPLVDNPLYKGVWAPRRIKNPGYYEDKTPANFEPIGAIGFELWTMQSGIIFDNIYIGHSIEDANKLRDETWSLKIGRERELVEKAKPKPKDDEETGKETASTVFEAFKQDPVRFVKEKVETFIAIAKHDPVFAIKSAPDVAGAFAVIFVGILALLFGVGSAGASSPKVQEAAAKAKAQAIDAKDKAADAIATGAEKAQAEVTKRTTRSAAADN